MRGGNTGHDALRPPAVRLQPCDARNLSADAGRRSLTPLRAPPSQATAGPVEISSAAATSGVTQAFGGYRGDNDSTGGDSLTLPPTGTSITETVVTPIP